MLIDLESDLKFVQFFLYTLYFIIRLLYCQKLGNFKFLPLKNNLCHQKAHKKLHIRHYYSYFGFLSGLRVIATSKCEK